ncbi:hypothetical protein [Dawidia soli]|uniref:hypothetical protein n=1 Tax=Dawidia soli TaxID=2782352 RepID=UPI0020B39908|nr:hypothetical protein [Dawidia soli]
MLTPLLYILIVLIIILSVSYYPSKKFSEQQWLRDKERRYELSEDLIEREILIGKTKPDVRLLLGDEGNADESNQWNYYLGFRPQLFRIDPDVLTIESKEGIVVRVEQHGT